MIYRFGYMPTDTMIFDVFAAEKKLVLDFHGEHERSERRELILGNAQAAKEDAEALFQKINEEKAQAIAKNENSRFSSDQEGEYVDIVTAVFYKNLYSLTDAPDSRVRGACDKVLELFKGEDNAQRIDLAEMRYRALIQQSL